MSTTCGDAGGLTRAGKPCGRRVPEGERCSSHNEGGQAETEGMKRAFLTHFGGGEYSMADAATLAGTSRPTVWRWRQADDEFAAKFDEIEVQSDELKLAAIEHANLKRILDGNAPAALVIFTMINISRRSRSQRVRERWKDVKHVVNTDIPIDWEKLSEDALQRIMANEDPMRVLQDEVERLRREAEGLLGEDLDNEYDAA